MRGRRGHRFATAALAAGLAVTAATGAEGGNRDGLAPRVEVGTVDALPPARSAEDRLAEIRRRIQEALIYPPSARRQGFEGVSALQFEIGADGRATGIEVVRTSGYPILDRAARRSVVDAGVLPYVYGRIQIPVSFSLEAGG